MPQRSSEVTHDRNGVPLSVFQPNHKPTEATTRHTHLVDFFDSMTLKNRTETCRVLDMQLSNNPAVPEMATVEVDLPVRKRLRVPITCLVCRYTGQRLPFPVENVGIEAFEIAVATL